MAESLVLDSYLPVYDTVPENWEQAREFFIENLKKISEITNVREIGFFLDEELLSGKQFIPGINNNQEFRSIFRKVVDCSPLISGVNNFAHGITFDSNFTLMQLYAAATRSAALVAQPIPNGSDIISMNSTNIVITTGGAWDRCFAVIEYIQEI